MTEETTSGLPTGRIDREPVDYPSGHYPTTAEKAALLADVFAAAGVDLGAYDERIAHWLADTADWSTFAVITSWVQRAGDGTQAADQAQGGNRCGRCRWTFDSHDKRFDGHARHADTPFCRRCTGNCHDGGTEHVCVICDPQRYGITAG